MEPYPLGEIHTVRGVYPALWGGRNVLWAFLERDADIPLMPVGRPKDMDQRLVADLALQDGLLDVALVADDLAVNGEDNILIMQASQAGRAFRQHAPN